MLAVRSVLSHFIRGSFELLRLIFQRYIEMATSEAHGFRHSPVKTLFH